MEHYGLPGGMCYRLKCSIYIGFQYRFLHIILPTNSFLTEIGIKQDPNCSFSRTTEENLAHLFWHCPKVQPFWGTLTEKLADFDRFYLETTRWLSQIFRPKVGYLEIFSSDKLLLSFSQILHQGL